MYIHNNENITTDSLYNALINSDKPSEYLKYIQSAGKIDFFPQLKALVGVPQEKRYHPEGDVWVHTLLVVDKASEICKRNNLSLQAKQILIFASLCHDFGKPVTTEFIDGKWRSQNHETTGLPYIESFLSKFELEQIVKEKILKICECHSSPRELYKQEVTLAGKVSKKALFRLIKRLFPATLDELLYVSEADYYGRGYDAEDLALTQNNKVFPYRNWLLKKLDEII